MKSPLLLASIIFFAPLALVAETKPAATQTVIPAAQLTEGLKSGLGAIISQALGEGKLSVTPPPALAKLQTALSKTDKAETASGFSDALAATVAKLSPQMSSLLQTSVKDLSVADASSVLGGGTDAATQFLKKSAAPALREKLLPLVKQATASTGLATKAKDMLALAGPLAGFGGSKAVSDLDGYVCDQVIAQSFALMSKQEAAVRANPALLSSNPLAQKAFALFKK
ncbi:DUF4197 family protein [Rariglobus hedericola]|uniref:DUF4197 domain-containing protein n=1 Tax=Rariglobus hedericola TaxID=2597822 RepID=A0A556QQT9_9BACT|nr:DUF4197 family protein [Rariglobus hedericola]TSJ79006.1 DUF4197 domain-containing protein [Rariglobus hedericola]